MAFLMNMVFVYVMVFCIQAMNSALAKSLGCGCEGSEDGYPFPKETNCGHISPPVSFLPIPQPMPIPQPVPMHLPQSQQKQSVTIPNIIMALLPPNQKPQYAPIPKETNCGHISPPISFLPIPQPVPIPLPQSQQKQSVTIPNIILALLPPNQKPQYAPIPKETNCGHISPPISFLPIPQPMPIPRLVPTRISQSQQKPSVTIPNIILALLPPNQKPQHASAPRPVLPVPQPYPVHAAEKCGCF